MHGALPNQSTQQGSDSTAMAICTLRRLSALRLLSSGRCCLRSPNPVVKACNALGSLSSLQSIWKAKADISDGSRGGQQQVQEEM